jgi:hypothetical protein
MGEINEVTKEIRNDTTAIKWDTSQILTKIDHLSGPLPARESRTQNSEDRNDSDSESNRRISKRYSILVICSIIILI